MGLVVAICAIVYSSGVVNTVPLPLLLPPPPPPPMQRLRKLRQ